jgi:hypothetical protein
MKNKIPQRELREFVKCENDRDYLRRFAVLRFFEAFRVVFLVFFAVFLFFAM